MSAAQKTITRRTVADLELTQTGDQLVIRGRRMAVGVSFCFMLAFVPFSLAIAYQNIVGTEGVPPLRGHPEPLAVVVLLTFLLVGFGVAPIATFIAFLRKRRHRWIFDRAHAQLTYQDQRWPLDDLLEVAVDVKRGRTRYHKQSASVVLHFRDATTLQLSRYYGSGGPKGHSLENRIAVAESLASAVGEFLELPVRHALPANPGFEVVTSLRA